MSDVIVAGLLVVVIAGVIVGLLVLRRMDRNITSLIKGMNKWIRKK